MKPKKRNAVGRFLTKKATSIMSFLGLKKAPVLEAENNNKKQVFSYYLSGKRISNMIQMMKQISQYSLQGLSFTK